jgi:hypothetical protein
LTQVTPRQDHELYVRCVRAVQQILILHRNNSMNRCAVSRLPHRVVRNNNVENSLIQEE